MDNHIFSSNPKSQIVATLGWQSVDQALWGIKDGFKNSGDDLVNRVLKEADRNNCRVLDTYIFPIMYLYRHSLEISLKIIYYRFFGKIPDGRHNLVKLWEKVYREIVVSKIQNTEFVEQVKSYKTRFIQFSMDGIDFAEITKLFQDIQDIDGKSDVFRYMVTRSGKPYFSQINCIDYCSLRNSITNAYNALDFIYEVCDEYLST